MMSLFLDGGCVKGPKGNFETGLGYREKQGHSELETVIKCKAVANKEYIWRKHKYFSFAKESI